MRSPTIAATAIKTTGTTTFRPMCSLSLFMSFKDINPGPYPLFNRNRQLKIPTHMKSTKCQ
jgi:hypothetical protein